MKKFRLRVVLWRFRYLILAATVCAIFLGLTQAILSLKAPEYEILVASRNLPAGTVLEQEDLSVEKIEGSYVPPKSDGNREGYLGKTLAASLPKGYPLSRDLLLGEEFLNTVLPGERIVSVTIRKDGTEALVKPGMVVTVFSGLTVDEVNLQVEPIVARATVVGIRTEKSKEGLFINQSESQVYFLAIPEDEVNLLVGHSARAPVKLVVHAP